MPRDVVCAYACVAHRRHVAAWSWTNRKVWVGKRRAHMHVAVYGLVAIDLRQKTRAESSRVTLHGLVAADLG